MEVSLIEMGCVIDERGQINFIDVENQIPFQIKNFFFIKDVPKHQKRGCHSNKISHEFIIAVQGEVEIELNREQLFKLTDTQKGLLVPANNWIELKNFSNDAICIVLGSEVYDESEKVIDAF